MKFYTRVNTVLVDEDGLSHIIPQGTKCTILKEGKTLDKVTLSMDGKPLVGTIFRKDIAVDFSNPEEEEIQNVIERGF